MPEQNLLAHLFPHHEATGKDNALCALVEKAQQGEAPAQERLLEQFQPLLSRWVAYATQNLPQEERAVLRAEVDFAFLDLLHQFAPQRGVPLGCYLQRMLSYRMRNFVRDAQRLCAREVCWAETVSEEEVGSLAPCGRLMCNPAAQDALEAAVLQVWLEGELGKMSALHRQVFLLHLQGWTREEIAAQLRKSPTRVQQVKEEARAWLRRAWDENFAVGD